MSTYIKISELPAATILDGTEPLPVVQTTTKKTTVRDVRNAEPVAKTADYTILDADSDVFEITTGAVDRTITFPTLADNYGRILEIHKVDAGAGKLTADGEGAETIDGNAAIVLPSQYNYLRVRGGTVTWHVLGMKANYDSGWVNQADLTDLTTTITHKLGVQIEALDCRALFATASTGAGASPVPLQVAYDRGSASGADWGVQFQDNSRSVDSVRFQTGAEGLLFLSSVGVAAGVTGTSYDYYRVIITRIK